MLTLWAGPRGQFGPILGPKNGYFLIIFIRIPRFIWGSGLVSCDRKKVVLSGKNLIFDKIICFPEVNWAQKWSKIENFGYVPFVLKFNILKHCSHTDFV